LNRSGAEEKKACMVMISTHHLLSPGSLRGNSPYSGAEIKLKFLGAKKMHIRRFERCIFLYMIYIYISAQIIARTAEATRQVAGISEVSP